jgi:phosphoglycolate phosphatase
MGATNPHILLIFDVDGTLTYSNGATGRAFAAAFARLTGVDVGPGAQRPFGMTDPQIFRAMLDRAHIQSDHFDEMFREFQELFVPLMRWELANATGARLLPGVRKLLDILSKDPRFALALGTGNLEVSGREKLRIHHADHYFPVGGFGSDAEQRPDVIRAAIRKARHHWNTNFPLSRTWIIGDTPKDIAAGKAVNANTLGVASSVFSENDLREANPDAVMASLEDQDTFLEIVVKSNVKQQVI